MSKWQELKVLRIDASAIEADVVNYQIGRQRAIAKQVTHPMRRIDATFALEFAVPTGRFPAHPKPAAVGLMDFFPEPLRPD